MDTEFKAHRLNDGAFVGICEAVKPYSHHRAKQHTSIYHRSIGTWASWRTTYCLEATMPQGMGGGAYPNFGEGRYNVLCYLGSTM